MSTVGITAPPNNAMQLTKLRAAPVLRAEVPPCAPAGQMDGGTASQLIARVRRTMGSTMTRRWLGMTIVVLTPALAWAEAPKPARPDLEVVLHVDGGMTEPPHYFILKVAFSGDVQGGGDLNPGLPAPPARLSAAAHAELAAILRKERFFGLPRAVGACPPDLGFRSIEAWQGTKKHTVTFCLDPKAAPLREVQAVLRTWYGLLSVVGQAKPVQPTGLDKELLAMER